MTKSIRMLRVTALFHLVSILEYSPKPVEGLSIKIVSRLVSEIASRLGKPHLRLGPSEPPVKERAVAQEFKQGDKVEWNTPQGKTRGTVKKKLTSNTEVGGQKINASEDDPRYLVESEKSGKEAAHKPDSLSKV